MRRLQTASFCVLAVLHISVFDNACGEWMGSRCCAYEADWGHLVRRMDLLTLAAWKHV